MLIGRISDSAGEDIGLELIELRILGQKHSILRGHLFGSFGICVSLEIEAAFQLRALSGEFLRIHRQVLNAGRTGADRHKLRHPRRAAEWSATGSDATDSAGLLARADLLHLDADLECVGKNADQLAEVYAFVGDIVENGLCPVALKLDITNLHIQVKIGGYLARTDHGGVLAVARIAKLLHIGFRGLAEDSLDFRIGGHVGLLHLQAHERTGEHHLADVVPRRSLHGHPITLSERYTVRIAVESRAGVFE